MNHQQPILTVLEKRSLSDLILRFLKASTDHKIQKELSKHKEADLTFKTLTPKEKRHLRVKIEAFFAKRKDYAFNDGFIDDGWFITFNDLFDLRCMLCTVDISIEKNELLYKESHCYADEGC